MSRASEAASTDQTVPRDTAGLDLDTHATLSHTHTHVLAFGHTVRGTKNPPQIWKTRTVPRATSRDEISVGECGSNSTMGKQQGTKPYRPHRTGPGPAMRKSGWGRHSKL